MRLTQVISFLALFLFCTTDSSAQFKMYEDQSYYVISDLQFPYKEIFKTSITNYKSTRQKIAVDYKGNSSVQLEKRNALKNRWLPIFIGRVEAMKKIKWGVSTVDQNGYQLSNEERGMLYEYNLLTSLSGDYLGDQEEAFIICC